VRGDGAGAGELVPTRFLPNERRNDRETDARIEGKAEGNAVLHSRVEMLLTRGKVIDVDVPEGPVADPDALAKSRMPMGRPVLFLPLAGPDPRSDGRDPQESGLISIGASRTSRP
jgi:hypothetical protein